MRARHPHALGGELGQTVLRVASHHGSEPIYKKKLKGSAILPLSAGSISNTALATSRLLQPRLVSTPKRTTTSAAVRGSLSISVKNAIGDEPSTRPDAELKARRSRNCCNSLLEFKRALSSSFDPPGSESKDTHKLSCAKLNSD